MEQGLGRPLVIVVVHVVIGLMQWVARRLVHLGGVGQYGLYMTLLPIGCSCFGWKIPPLMMGGWRSLGNFCCYGECAGRHR